MLWKRGQKRGEKARRGRGWGSATGKGGAECRGCARVAEESSVRVLEHRRAQGVAGDDEFAGRWSG